MPTQIMSDPKGKPEPFKTGSFRIGNPSSKRMEQAINSSRGSSLNQVLIILPKVECEFNLECATLHLSLLVMIFT